MRKRSKDSHPGPLKESNPSPQEANIPQQAPTSPKEIVSKSEQIISSKIEPVASKKKPRRSLTYKQQAFIKEYIANKGNGTQAALKIYDTNDYNTAHSISTENLHKPSVREELLKAMSALGMTLNEAIKLLQRQLHDDNPDLRHYLRMYFELQDAFPSNKTEIKTESKIILEQRTVDIIIEESRRALETAKEVNNT